MSRDHSLDDFSDDASGTATGDDAVASDDAGASADAADAEAAEDGDAEVAPAEPIRAWSPDGEVCSACGETATTRWRQDGAYVCPDCKEW